MQRPKKMCLLAEFLIYLHLKNTKNDPAPAQRLSIKMYTVNTKRNAINEQ